MLPHCQRTRREKFTLRQTHFNFYERQAIFLSPYRSVDFHSWSYSPKPYHYCNETRRRITFPQTRSSRALYQNAGKKTSACCNATYSNSSVSGTQQLQVFLSKQKQRCFASALLERFFPFIRCCNALEKQSHYGSPTAKFRITGVATDLNLFK